MRFYDYNRAENACRIGLTLSIIAVLLNALSLYTIPGNMAFDVFGVACAVLSMASAYFSESLHDDEYGDATQATLFQFCICACMTSYVVWLISFLA